MFEIESQLYQFVSGGFCACIPKGQWDFLKGNENSWNFTNIDCGTTELNGSMFLRCGVRDIGNITDGASGTCRPNESVQLFCNVGTSHKKCFGTLEHL